MKEYIYGGPHPTIPETSALALKKKKILHINHFLRLLWLHQVHIPYVLNIRNYGFKFLQELGM